MQWATRFRRRAQGERGQAVVEFAIIGIALFVITVGLADVGRGFFAYNGVAAAARYGARWGSVVGGTCALDYAQSKSDFCNGFSTLQRPGGFWAQPGTVPLQGVNIPCPSYSATPGDYYTASSFASSTASTIVGAIVHRYDSSDQNPGFVTGDLTPGFDLSKLEMCIAIDETAVPSGGTPSVVPRHGDTVSVVVYYPFAPVSPLIYARQIPLNASAQSEVE